MKDFDLNKGKFGNAKTVDSIGRSTWSRNRGDAK